MGDLRENIRSSILREDFEHVLKMTLPLWEELRGRRIFITGGTGFVGTWLLGSFAWANRELRLNAEAIVLTRDGAAFSRKVPWLVDDSSIKLYPGDVRDFKFPEGEFSLVIHGATEASSKLNAENPLLMLDTIVQGTRRTLDFAHQCQAQKVLFISSGAVYGKQPSEMTHVTEDYRGAPYTMEPMAAYGEGKRAAEFLCSIFSKQYLIETKVARCFAFVGPYLPLDSHFAVGNFIRDGLNGGPIRVIGDGTPFRSYLYAADLAIWLWTILANGKSCRAYNVGSEDEIAVRELALTVAKAFDPVPVVQIAGMPTAGHCAERYVPSIRRAETELRLRSVVSLPEGIRRTISFHDQEKRGDRPPRSYERAAPESSTT